MSTLTLEKMQELIDRVGPPPSTIIKVTRHTPFPQEIRQIGDYIVMSPWMWNHIKFSFLNSEERVFAEASGSLWGMRVEFDKEEEK